MSICLLAKRNISISSIQLNKCFISIKQTNKQREKKRRQEREKREKERQQKKKERKKSMCRIIILTIE